MSLLKKSLCVIFAFFTMISVSACNMPMKIIGSIPDPQKTVDSFFKSVCNGNFQESDKYLMGVSISMKKKIEDPFSQKLYEYLVESYSYSLIGNTSVNRLEAECKVNFTYLDFDLFSGILKDKSTELGKKYMANSTKGYVEKKDGAISITDDGAKKIAEEALDSVLSAPEKYYSTKEFIIALQYSGIRWQIIITDELFDAICGSFETETDK